MTFRRIPSLRIVLLLVASWVSFQHTTAQTNSSPYTRFGLGELVNPGYARSQSMGGTGIGLRLPNMLNVANPASYSVLGTQSVLFDVGLQYQQSQFKTASETQLNNGANLTHMALAMPIINKYWYMSVGLSPYSSVGYEVSTNQYKVGVGDQSTTYKGTGGINRVYWGNSLRLGGLSVGANFNYLFGTIDNVRTSTISDEKYQSVLNWEEHTVVRDFAFDYGVQYQHEFSPSFLVVVGLTYSQEAKLRSTRKSFITNSRLVNGRALYDPETGARLQDTLRNVTDKNAILQLPQQYGAGLSLLLMERLVVAADYHTGQWSTQNTEGQQGTLNDTERLSFGAEYVPNYRSLKYLHRVFYRFGYQQTNTYWRVGGQSVADQSVSLGFGFPLKRSGSVFDIALELGKRGKIDYSQIEETYLKVNVNFTLQDFWFIKRKFE